MASFSDVRANGAGWRVLRLTLLCALVAFPSMLRAAPEEELREATAAFEVEQFAKASLIFERVTSGSPPAVDPEARARAYVGLGEIHTRLARFGEARKDIERATELLNAPGAKFGIARAATLVVLGQLSFEEGKYKEAMDRCSAAVVQIRELRVGPSIWLVKALLCRGSAGTSYFDWNVARIDLDEARRFWDESFIAPSTKARLLRELARIYASEGRSANAAKYIEEAVALCELAVGLNSLCLAESLLRDAGYKIAKSNLSLGDSSISKAKQILEDAGYRDHPAYGRLRLFEAGRRLVVQDFADARVPAKEAGRIFQNSLGPTHSYVAEAFNAEGLANFGDGLIQDDRQKLRSAEQLLGNALAIRRQSLNRVDPDLEVSLRSYAKVKRALGRVEEAVLLEAEANALAIDREARRR